MVQKVYDNTTTFDISVFVLDIIQRIIDDTIKLKNIEMVKKYQKSKKKSKWLKIVKIVKKCQNILKNQNLQIAKYPHTTPFKIYN